MRPEITLPNSVLRAEYNTAIWSSPIEWSRATDSGSLSPSRPSSQQSRLHRSQDDLHSSSAHRKDDRTTTLSPISKKKPQRRGEQEEKEEENDEGPPLARFINRMEQRRARQLVEEGRRPPASANQTRQTRKHTSQASPAYPLSSFSHQPTIDIPRPLSQLAQTRAPTPQHAVLRTVNSAADVRKYLLASPTTVSTSAATTARRDDDFPSAHERSLRAGAHSVLSSSAASAVVVPTSSSSGPKPAATQPPLEWVRQRSALLVHLQSVPHERKKAFDAPLRSSTMSQTQKLLYERGYLEDSFSFLRPPSRTQMFQRSQ